MNDRLQVAFLWHFHQPHYVEPGTGRPALPWVRLHGIRGYTEMLDALERHPAMRVTLNFVPVLVDQLLEVADGVGDRWLTEWRGLAETFDPARAAAACAGLRSIPLAARRHVPKSVRDSLAAGSLTAAEFRDAYAWFLLAWGGPRFLARGEVRARLEQRRGFTVTDLDALLEASRAEVASCVPRARSLAERGQVELSASPYHHPILPLLCDLRAQDLDPATEPFEFRYPEDADDHLVRGLDRHETVFGRRPTGLWPSEGAVSEVAVERCAAAGLQWIASDEAVLRASWSEDATSPVPPSPYVPYCRPTAHGEIRVLFRDHDLSDRIGFRYSRQDPAGAVDDFVGRLHEIREQVTGDSAVVAVILDGENPWEHFADAGRPFLDELYGRLVADDSLEPVTMGQAAAGEAETLSRVATGSWIDGNLNTWAGHAEKLDAWRRLARVRAAAQKPLAELPDDVAHSLRALESSDWFWWLGDDHVIDHPEWFDDLFLAHLNRVQRGLGLAVERTPLRQSAIVQPVRLPLDAVAPGRGAADELEWNGAGMFEIQAAGGAMTPAQPMARRVRFGRRGDVVHWRVEELEAGLDVVLEMPDHELHAVEHTATGPRFEWALPDPETSWLSFWLSFRRGPEIVSRWPGRGVARLPLDVRAWSV